MIVIVRMRMRKSRDGDGGEEGKLLGGRGEKVRGAGWGWVLGLAGLAGLAGYRSLGVRD